MELHALQHVVDVEAGVLIIESDGEAERDQILCQRIHETSAEGVAGKRPSHRMDHPVQRHPGFPQLLDPEGEDLGIVGANALPRQVSLREWPACTLRENGYPSGQIHGRHVVRAGPTFTVEAGGCGADADDTVLLDQQALDRKPGKHVDAEGLRLLSQPPHDFADRGQVVAVVPHGGRRRDPECPPLGKEVDRLLADLAPKREITDV